MNLIGIEAGKFLIFYVNVSQNQSSLQRQMERGGA
jgi:hypothetical protein